MKPLLLIAGVSTLAIGVLVSQFYDTNDVGFFKVKQAAISGEISVIRDSGVYARLFGDIHEYKVSDVFNFDNEYVEIDVRFNDSATAKIRGILKFRMPAKESDIIRLHKDFRGHNSVVQTLVVPVVQASMKQSATFFGAEEVYSTRRAEFIDLVNKQIRDGIYQTKFSEARVTDEDGNRFIKRIVEVKKNDEGIPEISEISPFKTYGIDIIHFVINDIKFDERTEDLINKKKESEQQKLVAKTEAETAKQRTLTIQEDEKAKVAAAEADALVLKKTAVINAEKEREVAEQEAMKALEEKKKIIALGQAEAESAKLKVAAGLTPLEKATIDRDTAIGVAEQLSKVKFPSMMVLGGSGNNNSPLNPFDVVGLESFIKISKDLSKQ